MTPAKSLGRDLLARGFKVEVITGARGKRYEDMFGDIPMHVIKVGSLGAGVWGKVIGVTNLIMGVLQAMALIVRL